MISSQYYLSLPGLVHPQSMCTQALHPTTHVPAILSVHLMFLSLSQQSLLYFIQILNGSFVLATYTQGLPMTPLRSLSTQLSVWHRGGARWSFIEIYFESHLPSFSLTPSEGDGSEERKC
jgi:hypothetical protein